jgi:hypothetical protein
MRKEHTMKILYVLATPDPLITMIAFAVDQMPKPDCLGFTITRVDADGTKTVLPTKFTFENEPNHEWKSFTTDQKPIQRLFWFDMNLKAGWKGHYEVSIVSGTPAKPVVDPSSTVRSNNVALTSVSGNFQWFRNRAFPSMQALVRMAPKKPDGTVDLEATKARLGVKGDPIRELMSAGLELCLFMIPQEARKIKGFVRSLRYELTDPEVVDTLASLGNILEIILAVCGDDDKENVPASTKLKASKCIVHDRKVPSGHIPHQKTEILLDMMKKALKVLCGSCNATPTGIAGQINAMCLVSHEAIAQCVNEYFERVLADTQAGSKQSAALRSANNKANVFETVGANGRKTKTTIFFSPNTRTDKVLDTDPDPIDLAYLNARLEAAMYGVHFCFFQPGKRSLLKTIMDLANKNPHKVYRGTVSTPQAVSEQDAVELYHRSGTPVVVLASEIRKPTGDRVPEIYSFGHAITHFKGGAIDAWGPNPVCWWGTHNDGTAASSRNDEILWVVEGDPVLAQMIAMLCMDVYDHNRFRWLLTVQDHPADVGYLKPDSSWFKPEYLQAGTSANLEMQLMAGAFLDGKGQPQGGSSDGGTSETPTDGGSTDAPTDGEDGGKKPPVHRKPPVHKPKAEGGEAAPPATPPAPVSVR